MVSELRRERREAIILIVWDEIYACVIVPRVIAQLRQESDQYDRMKWCIDAIDELRECIFRYCDICVSFILRDSVDPCVFIRHPQFCSGNIKWGSELKQGSFVSRQGRTFVRKGIKIDIDSRRENEINLSGCLTNAFLNEATPTLTDRPRDQCCRRN